MLSPHRLGAIFAVLLAALSPARAQYTGPEIGQKVEFLGDSITQYGWDRPGGYVHLVDIALDHAGHKVQVIPAGISGQTSKDMLARIGDVLAKKPDWLLVSCGVNDVWHGANGVPLDQYKTNITSIVDQARASGAKVVLLASTPIGFNLTDDNNTKLAGYNDFLRDLAAQDQLAYVDLNKAMIDGNAAQHAQEKHQPGDPISLDGVHPNMLGNEVMATTILKSWGLTDDQLADITAKWNQIPNGMSFGAMQFDDNAGLTLHDYLILRAYAESQGKGVRDILNETIAADVKKAIDAAPDTTPANP